MDGLWLVHQAPKKDKLHRVFADPAFRKEVDDFVQVTRNEAQASAWFRQTYPQSQLRCVAYFSMEFMLSEALPIYSGGLGNVAGDRLKTASDLGVPMIGVGLLYTQPACSKLRSPPACDRKIASTRCKGEVLWV